MAPPAEQSYSVRPLNSICGTGQGTGHGTGQGDAAQAVEGEWVGWAEAPGVSGSGV